MNDAAPNALVLLDTLPREALQTARAHYAGTRDADNALTLAIVLNRLGNAQEALPVCDFAATEFAKRGENDQAARAWCESAWANTFIGDLRQASEQVEHARGLTTSPLLLARCDWIQARLLRSQSSYSDAIALFEKSREVFLAARLPLDAARCECEIAHTYIFGERGKALSMLERLRQTFERAGCTLDSLFCDWLMAIFLSDGQKYQEAFELLVRTRQKFGEQGADLYVARCDMILGIALQDRDRPEALKVLHQAHDYFLAHGIRGDTSACDINLGNVYYVLNRYDEALAQYQQAADLALADGRERRTAVLYNNMALIYAKQGALTRALDLAHRVLAITTANGMAIFTSTAHQTLAICYRELGQYDEALTHLQQKKDIAAQYQHRLSLVQCNIDLAEIHLACGESADAQVCLTEARDIATADGFDSFVAVCDRLLVQVIAPTASRENALAQIEKARTIFRNHLQFVDAALCDLTEGELRLTWSEASVARDYFQRARAVLSPAFPDQAWRADYGLAKCATASSDAGIALDHYLDAVRTIALSRSKLVTEQLSNDFFANRESVSDDALTFALQHHADESALDIVEASKARTFLMLLQNRGWKLRDDHGDRHVAELVTRERDLRFQLDALRRHAAMPSDAKPGDLMRSAPELASVSAAALQELNATSQAYESVVTQLRLAAPGLAGVSAPAPFALDAFRAVANATFGTDWVALDYYLADDQLTIVRVDAEQVQVEQKKLSDYDRSILEQCATADPEARELIYRHTLRGEDVPKVGQNYLRHLYRLLIPPDITARTLMISPHRELHALPFHALIVPSGDSFLIEHHTIVYAPSLQVMQLLLADSAEKSVARPLVFAVSQFDETLNALPFTPAEVAAVSRTFDGRGECWREHQATRAKLLDLAASGELAKFDLLHFATHAILDSATPHQSRIVLSDGALTTMDILDLTLNARLVVLSACQTALGAGGRGDEWVGLARAFFYAGARALVASLWTVEDASTVELIERFYRHWANGENIAEALRAARIEMIRAGYSPYQWAPFVLIGHP